MVQEFERCVDAARGTEARQAPRRYQNPILVGIVLLVSGISVAMIQYKVPTIMTDLMGLFSMDAATASWLMSIFTLVSIFVALPAGGLAQRFGAKNMLLVACGIAILGSLVGLAANVSSVLIVSRAIEGVALTVLTTCGPIIVQQNVRPDKVGTTMGIWGIWGCLGSTVAAVLTPTVFGMWGFDGLWIAFAVVTAIAAILVLVFIRTPQALDTGMEGSVPNVPDASGSVPNVPAGSRGLSPASQSATSGSVPSVSVPSMSTSVSACVQKPRYRDIFSKDMLLFFGAFVVYNICMLAILAFVPTILQMQGFDPTLSGIISTAPMLLSIISSPLFGVISDKIGRNKPLLIIAMLVMGPCTFLLFTQTGPLLWIGVFAMGLLGMGGIGQYLSGFTRLLPNPDLASVGMGVLVTFQGVGQFLGTFLVQMLLGPQLTEWWFAGIVLMVMGFAGTALIALCKLR